MSLVSNLLHGWISGTYRTPSKERMRKSLSSKVSLSRKRSTLFQAEKYYE